MKATLSEALAIALTHHQAGRLEMAEEVYRRILTVEPNHPDALHLLGVVAHQTGRHEVAIDCITQAIGLKCSDPGFHNDLGEAYRALARLPDAVACYRRALELEPGFVAAHNNLGVAIQELGQLQEATACYLRALELKPDYAEAHNNVGNAFQAQGNLDDAITWYQRALGLRPDYPEAHNNLGNALMRQGKLAEALASYRCALGLKPDYHGALNNLGTALREQGNLAEAVACYHRTLELKPDYAGAHNNLGNTLMDQGNPEEAVACFRRALELKPDYAEACNNLGNALRDQGRLNEAGACYRRAMELKPDYPAAHSNLLCCLQYQDGATLAELAHAHQEYERRHAAPYQSDWEEQEHLRDPHRKLRLGFVSPDFGSHPVGFFLASVLENLDRQQCEIICYHDRVRFSGLTARLRAAASTWREAYGLTDEQLAAQIRADGIDILFDLAGHTANNRLLVFARKPAPVQITWAGYVGTTGLRAMDYILADRHEIPPTAERHYCEKTLRMPDGYICYAPPDRAPPVSSLPAITAGHCTFASFNNPAKMTERVVECWADILLRVPGARLVLQYRGLDGAETQQRYRGLLAAKGVQRERVDLRGGSPHADLLASYGRVDVALDTFPYSGGLTTCEALWMGVPVITWPGETFAGRHGLTHLSNIGLAQEFVAIDRSDYVERAVRWANDLERLADVRASLRGRMAVSPLCDGPRFAANLLTLLQDVWRNRAGGNTAEQA